MVQKYSSEASEVLEYGHPWLYGEQAEIGNLLLSIILTGELKLCFPVCSKHLSFYSGSLKCKAELLAFPVNSRLNPMSND